MENDGQSTLMSNWIARVHPSATSDWANCSASTWSTNTYANRPSLVAHTPDRFT